MTSSPTSWGRWVAFAATALALVLTGLGARDAAADAIAPTATDAPTVAGVARVGERLSADPGTWSGDAPITYAYQWRRCDAEGNDCADVTDATEDHYRLRAADLGTTLQVVVTASNATGNASAESAVGDLVDAGGPYAGAVLGTSGLEHYWRLGEPSGATLFDSVGSADATASNVTLGADGALGGDLDSAASFDGSSSVASAPLDLSGTDKATIEFWLKWNSFADDDRLAMEFTPNFNSNDGGFLVDPNSSAGKFSVAIGSGSRGYNNVQFDRPSAGAWHHYALVIDTAAAAGEQVTPYVDGQAVAFTKLNSGTNAGTFADSTLYFMSRAATSLLGAGDLDDLAIYTDTLDATTIHDHYHAGEGTPSATDPPTISGKARDGDPLRADPGTWDGIQPVDYAYQWQRCDVSGANCADIADAVAQSLELTTADVGHTLRIVVTGTNAAGTATAVSSITGVVRPVPPSNTEAPTLAGLTRDGATLHAATGQWTGTTPITFSYRWLRCDAVMDDCEVVDGQTASTYRLGPDDTDGVMRVEVTASNASGSRAQRSEPTELVDADPPTTASQPTITGDLAVGQTLDASTGEWSGADGIVYHYEWQRCSATTTSCAAIEGADGETYVVTPEDIGSRLRLKVDATNSSGSSSATSALTLEITADPAVTAPQNQQAPAITGTTTDGRTLTATTGTWAAAAPVIYTYAWQRCDSDGLPCDTIADAAGATYRLAGDDIGSTLRVLVTAANPGGRNTATSAATDTVEADPPVSVGAPTVDGTAETWHTLVANEGDWDGAPIGHFVYTWLRCPQTPGPCVEIAGATGRTYQVSPADIDHPLEVRVAAENNSGNATATSAPTTAVTGETTAPAMTLSGSLADTQPSVLGYGSSQLHIDATDANSGVAELHVLVDGFEWWSFDQDCPDGACALRRDVTIFGYSLDTGAHTVSVTAVDQAGNQTTQDLSVLVDRDQPTLELDGALYDSRGHTVAPGTYALGFSTSDGYAGIRSLEVRVDGLRRWYEDDPLHVQEFSCDVAPCHLDRTFTFDTNRYRAGAHNITVTATDRVGNTRTQTFVVTTPAGAAPALDSSIAFVRNGALWRASESGDQQQALSPACSDDCASNPSIAPDASRIAYDQDGELRIMATDGSHDRGLPHIPGANAIQPSFTADGTRLIFTKRSASGDDIYEVSTDGQGLRPLVTDPGDQRSASLSSDGSWMLYDDDGTITIEDPDGDSAPQPLDVSQDVRLPTAHPAFSPDATRIAFDGVPQGESDLEIFVVEVATGEVTQLTHDQVDERHPSWSPDGQSITFEKDGPAGGSVIDTVPSAGGEIQPLLVGAETDSFASASHRTPSGPEIDVDYGAPNESSFRDFRRDYTTGLGPMSVTVSATDDLAGIASLAITRRDGTSVTSYDVPCGPSCEGTARHTFSVPIAGLPEGRADLVATATNTQGVRSATPVDVLIDRTAPPTAQLSATLDPDTRTARIDWTADPDPDLADGNAGSGLEAIKYRTRQGAQWSAWQTTEDDSFYVLGVDDGDVVDFETQTTDAAGNTSATQPDTLVITTDEPAARASTGGAVVSDDAALRTMAETNPDAIGASTPALNDGEVVAPHLAISSVGAEDGQPAGGLADSGIGQKYADGMTLSTNWGMLTVTPLAASAAASEGQPVDDHATLFANTAASADTLVRPTALGLQALTQLRDIQAPERYSWQFDLPGGASLVSLSDGSVAVLAATSSDIGLTRAASALPSQQPAATPARNLAIGDTGAELARGLAALNLADSETIGYVAAVIGAPWAKDATGRAVPATYEVTGNTLTLSIKHRAAGYDYPIMADPDLYDCAPAKASPCGRYDPRAAGAYAHKWFNDHNPNYPNFEKRSIVQPAAPGGGDCTNFMSQSLRAGGLSYTREYQKGEGSWWVLPPLRQGIIIAPFASPFWKYTRSWTLAEDLYDHLVDYNLGTVAGAGRNGTTIDPSLLHIGDVIFLDWDNHPGRWDHSQFVTGRDPRTGEFLLAQHSGPYEKQLSDVNQRYIDAHHAAWGWVIVHPIHTRVDLDFGIT